MRFGYVEREEERASTGLPYPASRLEAVTIRTWPVPPPTRFAFLFQLPPRASPFLPKLIIVRPPMKDALKRSPSPFQPANKKKAKQEHDWDQDSIPFAPTKSRRSPSYEPDLLTFGNNHNRGAEFKRISDLNHSSVVNATIVQTTRELSAVGKRLIQAPKLL